uniref:Uncharacterized protein n=1 Tax=Zea mays TaxID=4577 RepID=C4J8A5_MAIZE|nr:unknown [Zea mays]
MAPELNWKSVMDLMSSL